MKKLIVCGVLTAALVCSVGVFSACTRSNGNARVQDGVLADVAPSILHIMGLEQPVEMTGRCLIYN